MNLLWRNRQIFTVPHPRLNGWAEALLLELLDQTFNAALLFDEAVDDRDHFSADCAADKTVQETHFFLHK